MPPWHMCVRLLFTQQQQQQTNKHQQKQQHRHLLPTRNKHILNESQAPVDLARQGRASTMPQDMSTTL